MHTAQDVSVSQEDKLVAALIYGISFFTAFIGPLVIWILKKDSSDFVDHHGREYLNFFISYTIYGLIASLLALILIGFLILGVLGIAAFVITVVGIVKAIQGDRFRIPFIFRLL
ncbi:DUF4870 domain-containing protein [Paenalkalicoccus suaedae]|uniref:DUF4870 domain-containing protein n=1 Tax=Paenalkalicoccus suaedae TaxID=2592382 RepID=A0A859FFL0_9BACI|nr:DUF4870 domain-containing protein [Paenalkalicoccus suaedae]QKS71630.1 DUF4870 domain-containing protein [Paenalkalicoccus suaedae]